MTKGLSAQDEESNRTDQSFKRLSSRLATDETTTHCGTEVRKRKYARFLDLKIFLCYEKPPRKPVTPVCGRAARSLCLFFFRVVLCFLHIRLLRISSRPSAFPYFYHAFSFEGSANLMSYLPFAFAPFIKYTIEKA